MALKVLKAIQSLARAWPPRGPRAALASIRWLRWSNARRPTMGPHDLTLVGTRRRNRPSASKKSTSHVPPPHGSRRPPLPETPIRYCRGEIDLGGGSGVWELELGSWRPIRQRRRELLCSGGAGEARLRRLTAAAVSQSRTLSPLRRRRELRAPLYCDGGACSRSSLASHAAADGGDWNSGRMEKPEDFQTEKPEEGWQGTTGAPVENSPPGGRR